MCKLFALLFICDALAAGLDAEESVTHEFSPVTTAVAFERDHFENNNSFEHATYFGFSLGGWTNSWAEPTIHDDGVPDKDIYFIRGVGGSTTTNSEDGVKITSYAGVRISNF